MRFSLSIIFPVFNEAKRLQKTFEAVSSFRTPEIFSNVEIIFVNDGSRDGSASLIKEFKCGWPVKLISYEKNRGKGFAIRTGMLAASGDWRLMLDADMSTPLDELEKFARFVEAGCPVIIGSRKTEDAKVIKAQPRHRELLGIGYYLLAKLVTGVSISDFTCGFKMFSKDAALAIFSKSKIDRWSYDSEIMYLAKKIGFKICEVGVDWENDADTKVSLKKDTLQSLIDLIKIRFTRY